MPTGRREPETRRRIEDAVRVLAERDYPIVWIGEEGLTADELLALQMNNDKGPDWLRVEPGELVQVEGDEEGGGIQMPKVSHRWLDGLWVYQHMSGAVPEADFPLLQEEVTAIHAAKQGMVMVEYLSNIRFATGDELDELTEEDRLFARFRFTSTGEAVAVVFLGRRCRPVPLDELTEEDVDENLIDGLEILVGEGPGSYVIPDTEEARRALEQRLRNS